MWVSAIQWMKETTVNKVLMLVCRPYKVSLNSTQENEKKKKNDKGLKETFLQQKYTNGQQTYVKMLRIIKHGENDMRFSMYFIWYPSSTVRDMRH